MDCSQIIITGHARERLFSRGITVDEIREIITKGEVVEDYPNDMPYPSMLLLGWIQQKPIHVVLAQDKAAALCVVVTVYVPDLRKWEPGFKKRRK